MFQAPLVPRGTPVVNALAKQRACIENILRACLALPAENNMLLEHKLQQQLVHYDVTTKTPSTNGLITKSLAENMYQTAQKNCIQG